jgi:hypothetical protein
MSASPRKRTWAERDGSKDVWSKIMNEVARAYDAAVQMIDTSIVRVHH